MNTEDISHGRYYTPEVYHYPANRIRPEAGFTELGQVPVGNEVRWYRYWRFGEHRFNNGYVLEHLAPRYLNEPGITRFAVTLEKNNKVLVVPMCSGLRIRLTAPKRGPSE